MKRTIFLTFLFVLMPIVGRCQSDAPIKGFNMIITRTLSLLVQNDAIEVAAVTTDYKVAHISPELAAICDRGRLERNLIAAAKGSKKALRYVNKCLSKMPKKEVTLFYPIAPAECAGQYLQYDANGNYRWVPPCKEKR